MKAQDIIAVIITALVSHLSAQEVEFVARGRDGHPAQLRIGKELVWAEDKDANTSPLNVKIEGYEPYANCRLLASARRGDDLLVALEFAFDKKLEATKRLELDWDNSCGVSGKSWCGDCARLRMRQVMP